MTKNDTIPSTPAPAVEDPRKVTRLQAFRKITNILGKLTEADQLQVAAAVYELIRG